jgi:hypothetical protein
VWSKRSGMKPMSGTAFGKRAKKRFTHKRLSDGLYYEHVALNTKDLFGGDDE